MNRHDGSLAVIHLTPAEPKLKLGYITVRARLAHVMIDAKHSALN